MKTHALPRLAGGCRKLVAAGLVLLPSLATAHPGHHHPAGEDDEFDALRANYFHLHGALEITLALVALAAVLVFNLNKNRRVRVGAALVFGGSLALIAAF